MTNYEKFQLEKYGNIIGYGEKASRELSVMGKAELILEQIRDNNIRILDLINDMPDNSFKVDCLKKLESINERTLQTVSKLTEQKLSETEDEYEQRLENKFY